jgi:hypothetical protein
MLAIAMANPGHENGKLLFFWKKKMATCSIPYPQMNLLIRRISKDWIVLLRGIYFNAAA